jgi:hypothetical protein
MKKRILLGISTLALALCGTGCLLQPLSPEEEAALRAEADQYETMDGEGTFDEANEEPGESDSSQKGDRLDLTQGDPSALEGTTEKPDPTPWDTTDRKPDPTPWRAMSGTAKPDPTPWHPIELEQEQGEGEGVNAMMMRDEDNKPDPTPWVTVNVR